MCKRYARSPAGRSERDVSRHEKCLGRDHTAAGHRAGVTGLVAADRGGHRGPPGCAGEEAQVDYGEGQRTPLKGLRFETIEAAQAYLDLQGNKCPGRSGVQNDRTL